MVNKMVKQLKEQEQSGHWMKDKAGKWVFQAEEEQDEQPVKKSALSHLLPAGPTPKQTVAPVQPIQSGRLVHVHNTRRGTGQTRRNNR
jgi:Rod binding domain-containing protein